MEGRRDSKLNAVPPDRIVRRGIVRPEAVDTVQKVGLPGLGARLRAGRALLLVEVEAADGHPQSAQLHDHVRTPRQLSHRRTPVQENLVSAPSPWPDAERPTDVVENDRDTGKATRQICQPTEL